MSEEKNTGQPEESKNEEVNSGEEKSEKNKTTDEKAESTQEKTNEQVETGVAQFEEFEENVNKGSRSLERLKYLDDMELNVYIELGRTSMPIKDILELERGYVIELDKMASEPVDIYVNNKKVAEGEVVVIDKHFGIRITNLNSKSDRLQELN